MKSLYLSARETEISSLDKINTLEDQQYIISTFSNKIKERFHNFTVHIGDIINTMRDLSKDDNWLECKGQEFDTKKYLAVTNIGVHPSINKLKNPIIEAHIIDSDDDLYGKEISLFIYKKERDEKQFDDIGSLKKQILLDKENCVKYFSN